MVSTEDCLRWKQEPLDLLRERVKALGLLARDFEKPGILKSVGLVRAIE